MSRRHRREFQALESQLEYGVVDEQWRALIDKILYNKGPGSKPIREQLRLRARLRRLHARRDRYNQKRYEQRYQALVLQLEPRQIIAGYAIGMGIVESTESPLPRSLLIGAMAGDRRLTKKLFEELETVYETFYPSVEPRNSIAFWAKHFRTTQPTAREERQEFEQLLQPTPIPKQPLPDISFGFQLTPASQTNATSIHSHPPATRAAS